MPIAAPLLALGLSLAGGCAPIQPVNPMQADEPCPGIIGFSGLRWRVSSGRVQGDTRWSRCRVEQLGEALRLMLSRAAGEPYRGAQIALAAGDEDAHLGFGRYEFMIDSVPRQALPPRGVFAMFSYGGPSGIDRRGVWGYNEIDVEINRSWLRAENGRAVGRPPVYTVWPAGPAAPGGDAPRKPLSAHLPARTRPDPLALASRHVYDWAPGSVRLSSWNAGQESPFFAWAATDDVGAGTVPSTPMIPMINLWTVAGARGRVIEDQSCGGDYPCGTWTVVVRSVRLPVPIHKHAGDGQQGRPGAPLPHPLVVRVADERGRPMPGVLVEFAVTGGRGTLTAAADRLTTLTDADGLARTAWTLGNAGAQEVQACVVNGTRPPVSFSAASR